MISKKVHGYIHAVCIHVLLFSFFLELLGIDWFYTNMGNLKIVLDSMWLCICCSMYYELHGEKVDQQVIEPDKRHLREQLYDILGEDLSEENVNRIGKHFHINDKVIETTYLYLDNSKNEVANILDIEPSTVIRRVKRYIEITS